MYGCCQCQLVCVVVPHWLGVILFAVLLIQMFHMASVPWVEWSILGMHFVGCVVHSVTFPFCLQCNLFFLTISVLLGILFFLHKTICFRAFVRCSTVCHEQTSISSHQWKLNSRPQLDWILQSVNTKPISSVASLGTESTPGKNTGAPPTILKYRFSLISYAEVRYEAARQKPSALPS